ncbi:LANO_0H25026g1_1 [Lachancea nothofagi CBS 11611]|uniref:LANO_0H25026g1_1 n=1 Tax=Lachancea nothofagi CBS 11611 TaxID=1266666 RepID=A0A1G4KNW8_9SACH|nr:LANO_0H25026g1_1 [Lachancea nothofagi CBS 11611]
MSDLTFTPEVQALLDFDRKHLWHPYTSMSKPLPVFPVKSASGATITLDAQTSDSKDATLIEAMSSWWCMIHGYNNPELNEAMISQIKSMSHVMFGGLTHGPAVRVVQKLLTLIDHKNLQCCFLADSGSVAVEIALKMALQYEFTKNGDHSNDKAKFLTIRNGYHGDTFGAMSVCDPVSSMHSIYTGYLPQNIFVSAPTMLDTLPTSNAFATRPEVFAAGNMGWDDHDIDDFKKAVETRHSEICAVILEPILQGAGGMRLYHPQYLIEVRKLCDRFEIPLIMDEIATGFGRTGAMFAFQHCRTYQDMQGIQPQKQVDVYPDILCVGKALTGGYMTLSAVVTTEHIKNVVSSSGSVTGGCFMHGPTFMGNPLACSAADKSLEILLRGHWRQQVDSIESQLVDQLYVALNGNEQLMHSLVRNVRVVGAVGVVELTGAVDSAWFHDRFVAKGVYVRPFGRLIYIMPPYVISREELARVTRTIVAVLGEWKAELEARDVVT